VPADTRMTQALSASLAWCQRQRSDLPEAGPVSADVQQAVLIYAGLLFRERTHPQGFPTYEELAGGTDTGAAMSNVFRLLGHRKPVAR
jgi:hypothetical protein